MANTRAEPRAASVDRAKSLIQHWTTEPWDDVAEWLRDEPELHELSGLDRVLALVAAMHMNRSYAVRDARRVTIHGERDGELAVSAPQANPFVLDEAGLVPPWREPVWIRATPSPAGTAVAHQWLRQVGFTAHRCESVAARLSFADAVFAMLARSFGPPEGWRVFAQLGGEPLRQAYCCGFDGVIVQAGDEALMLVQGMYC